MAQASWDDFRIAYQVAQSGTLSKAGRVLQMNHATVLRHINQLEEALEVKLFIRHQRGYQLSDAGRLMVSELPDIFKSFSRLENQLGNVEQNISGSLRITTVSDYSALLTPALKEFRQIYPQLRVQVIATDDVLSLASGAAHVSLRVGPQPNESDLIVKKLMAPNIHYYAADSYVQQYGLPKTPQDYTQHLWALPSEDKRRIPFVKLILKHIKEEQIIYQSNHFPDITGAIAEGMGIGPMAAHQAIKYQGLHKLDIDIDQKGEGLWFVYHKDLKNSARIQALYSFLIKSMDEESQKWR